jgi:hypothetical protein
MLNKKKPSQPDDELTARLRTAARKRRPWTLTGLCIMLALILIPAGTCLWWFYPRPAPPTLEIVAFDQLGLPGAEITVRAHLEPIQPPEEPPNLAGFEVTFEEELLPLQAAKERKQVKVLSGRQGNATTAWVAPADKSAGAYMVRQMGGHLRPGGNDRAQIFSWPAGTPLLLVDVQQTLAGADAEAWRKRNVLDIAPVAGAGKALQEARKNKYEIVYLAIEPDSSLIYRKQRGWVANQRSIRDAFPPGPVLGRPSFEQEASQAREAVLRALRKQFTGPLIAAVATSEAAAVSRAVGLETIVIGDAEAPVEVVHAKSWAEVVRELQKRGIHP